ncbi:Dihydrolipoyllysine-residue acetyltransferase component of pyruvate dehydrogenase complex [Brevibacterium ravenspurgense]|uniref:Dihydrolipoamide acetyltransferase component of pyruvate dehydrogenase complex n=1 Tax=Brevibacterium ravenspurgense TaxID=479117 RepID=A0A150H637_9MICO|nr:dihydrolipoamide acetyltransferase family protein [Brevibacterium ravenspurgense]KXZ57475.1 Dihydrolipoyllysine-residue acetyltransferase component of pyruvate dehydrogenase complex [Brevibacterium ravenspurgense]
MTDTFLLPDPGEGLTEADIISWKVAAGDTVTVNQILVEIETAKSLVELPSPHAGVIAKLLVEEGQTVEVGTPILQFEGDGSASGDTPAADAADDSADDEGSGPNLVGYGTTAQSKRRRPRKGQQAQPEAPAAAAPAAEAKPAAQPEPAAPARAGHALAKPPVRKLAKDNGINLADVPATGEGGIVTRADLVKYMESGQANTADAPATGTSAAAAAPGTEERIPFKGVTKFMAQAMVDSAFTAPHVTEFLDVDMTETMELVRRFKASGVLGDVKLSPLAVVAKAVTWAVARNPRINSSLEGDEIVVKHYVNLGIAAATPRGLVVPNIKDAHAMGLGQLAGEIRELALTAREGRTTPAAQTGGTITITNVGVFGVDAGTPIINPGEAAILAFGQVRQRPWVVDGEIVPREITTLAVSADHRLVDGEIISKFLADVGRALEDPAVMLA